MIKCDRCGKVLPPGSTKYLVIIQATADFDGFFGIEDFKYSSDLQLEKLIQGLSKEPDGKAMKDVFEKKALILCPDCKKAFMKNPLDSKKHEQLSNGRFLH